ncbi:GHKL domain-containing protein [bacterium]|nr:GHKL domain-containing protein [bacterium]
MGNMSQLNQNKAIQYLIENEKYARIGRLANGLAHNLQSPLTAIKGYAQLIQLDRGKIEEIELILKEVELVQSITHNLLRIMRQLQDMSIRQLLLNDMIRLELEFLNANLIFKHKIKKYVSLDPELPFIQGVYSDFSQMIMNLLLNSIEAMTESPEKKLFVETRHDDSHVYIQIRDTGKGIPKNMINHIMDPFFTTSGKEKNCKHDPSYSGTSIGLMIVKTLVEKYRGIFDIQSDKKGTRAIIKIIWHD